MWGVMKTFVAACLAIVVVGLTWLTAFDQGSRTDRTGRTDRTSADTTRTIVIAETLVAVTENGRVIYYVRKRMLDSLKRATKP
jgi:hypothetical protein